MTVIMKCKDISKAYDNKVLFNKSSFYIKQGEKVGVYGTLREVKEAIIKEMIKDEVNHRKTEPLYKLIPLMRQMYDRFYEENMECCFVG